jgi:hypothetical protein
MQNGIRFVGDLYDLRDSREDRERKIKRQEAKDRREEGRYNIFSRQSDDSHERSLREQEEYDANADLRELGRKNKILKARRTATELGDDELYGLVDKAKRAKLQDSINTKRKNEIALAIAEATKDAKIDKIKNWKKDKTGKSETPRYEAVNGMSYTVKDVSNAYDKYLKYAAQKGLEEDEILSQKEFIGKLFNKKSAPTGEPAPKPKPGDIEDLSKYDPKGNSDGWFSRFLNSF